MTYEEFKEKVGSVILTDEGNCPVTPVVQMLQGKWSFRSSMNCASSALCGLVS